jgi:hypothetical protein
MAKHFNMTSEEYIGANEENMGFCTECGTEHYECEPDACGYTCDNCGKKTVYGLEELLLMGLVTITD